MVDDAKLHQFIGQMLSDLGGAASISLVRIGDALGLYKIIHERGPMTVAELAAASGVHERYLREWLSHQAASNYLSYDSATQKFALPPEQAMVFAIEDSPVYMMGAFDLMTWMVESKGQVQAVFPDWRRSAVERSHKLLFLRGRALFPTRLPQQFGEHLASRAQRCRR